MSSFDVTASPEDFSAAAQDLTGIGSSIRAANSAAAASTTRVAVAAQDEVSAAIAALFGTYGREYQAAAAQTAAFHEQFTSALRSAGNSYAATEAENSDSLSNDPLADIARTRMLYIADLDRLVSQLEQNQARLAEIERGIAIFDHFTLNAGERQRLALLKEERATLLAENEAARDELEATDRLLTENIQAYGRVDDTLNAHIRLFE